jgi:uncharacterized membrane protein YhaH (DUF805 family)
MLFLQVLFRPFLNYFTFSGRASRFEYLLFWLVRHITFIALNICVPRTPTDLYMRLTAAFLSFPMNWPAGIAGALFIVPTLAIYVRRLHDFNRSAFWLIAVAVPVFFERKFTFMAVVVGAAFMREADDETLLGVMPIMFGPVLLLESLIFITFLLIPPSRGSNKYGSASPTIGPAEKEKQETLPPPA